MDLRCPKYLRIFSKIHKNFTTIFNADKSDYSSSSSSSSFTVAQFLDSFAPSSSSSAKTITPVSNVTKSPLTANVFLILKDMYFGKHLYHKFTGSKDKKEIAGDGKKGAKKEASKADAAEDQEISNSLKHAEAEKASDIDENLERDLEEDLKTDIADEVSTLEEDFVDDLGTEDTEMAEFLSGIEDDIIIDVLL